ncbi:MAG: archease [Methanosarcinales archaeon Met12]|nr:MAG: archease [Methanosarcinales archaeon Met12]
MKKFEFLDFATADVCFRAYGATLDEVFANAALAMFETMVETKGVVPKITKDVEVNGEDLVSLMFNWLNELLFYVDAEGLVFSRFNVKVDERRMTLSAKATGEQIDFQRHETKTDVKACTYHDMTIEKRNGKWVAQVILDV